VTVQNTWVFSQPSYKHELGASKLRIMSQAKDSIVLAHTTKHVPHKSPQKKSNIQDTSQACEQKGRADQTID